MKITAEDLAPLVAKNRDCQTCATRRALAVLDDDTLDAEEKLDFLNGILEGFGVEPISVEGEWLDNYHGDIVASYINQGDSYSLTIVHDHESGELVLTSWADWLEEWERTHEREPEAE